MTKLNFSSFFIAFIYSSLHAAESNSTFFAEDTLKNSHGHIIFSSVLFRHGDRTITNSYKNDPYPLSFWKEGLGELTQNGKKRSYELGQWLKERYKDTLIGSYSSDKLVMHSSDVNRTIMSGLSLLAGAYPPARDEIWSTDGISWQPIPIHVISVQLDNLIGDAHTCDRVDFEYDLLNSNEEIRNIFRKHEEVIKYISENSGMELSANNLVALFQTIWDIYDTLYVQEMNNLTLPTWTKKVYPEPLRMLGTIRYEIALYTLELKRLKAGPLLGSMVIDMKNKRSGALPLNIHYYSGHDTTLAPLMIALGVYDKISAAYSAAVLIELRQKENDYFVTVMYRNSSDAPPYLLKVPGCDDVCSLDQFIEIVNLLIPTDWNAECEVTIFTRLQYLNLFYLIVIIILILIVGLMIFVILRMFTKKRRLSYDQL